MSTFAMLAPVLTPPPAAASSQWASAEQLFTNHVNRERVERGLGTLAVSLQMVRIARDWSGQMAARDVMAHRPDIPAHVYGPWTRLGENVGWISHRAGDPLSATVERLHREFMDSPGHKANVLGQYNQLGVGVLVAETGKLWVTFNFLEGPLGQFPLFVDIGSTTHERSIEQAWMADLASGCRFDRFCPAGQVTRAQMATFVARAVGLTPVVSNRFVDVDPRSLHAGAINALVEAGIAQGCGADRFCPNDAVSRAQMATFLMRALELSSRTSVRFIDVLPTSPHFGAINAVAEEAITSGCDGTGLRYCPGDLVRRDQMASFLVRAFPARVTYWQSGQASMATAPASTATLLDVGAPVTYVRGSGN